MNVHKTSGATSCPTDQRDMLKMAGRIDGNPCEDKTANDRQTTWTAFNNSSANEEQRRCLQHIIFCFTWCVTWRECLGCGRLAAAKESCKLSTKWTSRCGYSLQICRHVGNSSKKTFFFHNFSPQVPRSSTHYPSVWEAPGNYWRKSGKAREDSALAAAVEALGDPSKLAPQQLEVLLAQRLAAQLVHWQAKAGIAGLVHWRAKAGTAGCQKSAG